MTARQRIVLVTGLSGAGKNSILQALEDLGYEAVDNPPLDMVPSLVGRGERPIALGVDARSRGFDASSVLDLLATLRRDPALHAELAFAWAEESVLLRRYTESRRRHPLAPEGRVIDGIEAETLLTQRLREAADLVIDTSELALGELRHRIAARYDSANEGPVSLAVAIVSFAFRAGLPREADMVFDARFLRNPHYDTILRSRTGLDPEVAAYVEADPDYLTFFSDIMRLLDLVLPRFVQEGKRYVTVAIGCTGGQHRSVRLAEAVAEQLQAREPPGIDKRWQVAVTHRELARLQGAPGP